MNDRSRTGRFYNWQAIIARLQTKPGRWERTLPNAPARLVRSVRLRRHPDLRREDGVLEAMIQNEYVDEYRRRRGDVLLRWIPCDVGPEATTLESSDNRGEGHE